MKKTALTVVFAAVWSLSAFCQTVPGLAEIRRAPDRSRNYVMETIVRKSGVTDTVGVNALGGRDAMRTVTYHDGLGYPVQTVQVGAVPGGGHYLVLHREYDRYMRESRIWLPYADMGPSEAGFRKDASGATESFYAAGIAGMKGDTHPYSETVYEGSLLGRVLEQGFPGAVWQPAGHRTDSTGRTTVTLESGEEYDQYTFVDFADPESDPEAIDSGEIDQLVFVSEEEISSVLDVFVESDLSLEGFYNGSVGGAKYDYYSTYVSPKYEDSSAKLFIPEGDNMAHNNQNFGNFLWAMTGRSIGIPTLILRLGAHYNSYINPHGGNGYKSQWDSSDDQRSIRAGAKYARKHNLLRRR